MKKSGIFSIIPLRSLVGSRNCIHNKRKQVQADEMNLSPESNTLQRRIFNLTLEATGFIGYLKKISHMNNLREVHIFKFKI